MTGDGEGHGDEEGHGIGDDGDGYGDDGDALAYFEDLEVGQEWDAGSTTITEADILSFAHEFDPQSFHVDPEAAQRHFDGLIASGWHTASACMRLLVEAVLDDVAVVAAQGIDELRWHQPVYAGDTLSVDVSVVDKTAWTDERGRVIFRLEATNQDDEVVHTRKELVVIER